MTPKLQPLRLSSLVVEGRTIRFRQPIEVRRKFEGGLFIHEHGPLGIVVGSHSQEESLEFFRSAVLCRWQEIGLADDSELTRDAVVLKRELRSVIEAVE